MPLRLALSADPASPGVGLSRRRSLLKRPSLQTSSNDTTNSELPLPPLIPLPRVPTEILECIIDYYVLNARSPVLYGIPDTANSLATFTSYIEPHITVSKGFRYLLLRSFFRVLVLGKEDAVSMLRLLSDFDNEYRLENGGFLWVKFVPTLLKLCCLILPLPEMLNICAYIQVTYLLLVSSACKPQNPTSSHSTSGDANRLYQLWTNIAT